MNDMPPRVSRTGTAVGNLARHRHLAAVLAGSLAIGAAMAAATAATDTRTLDLYNNHTKERLTITFKKNGRYIPSALAELNRFLRDWRRNESITMDPRLFDTVWELHQRSGAVSPLTGTNPERHFYGNGTSVVVTSPGLLGPHALDPRAWTRTVDTSALSPGGSVYQQQIPTVHQPDHDSGIRWDSFGFDWGAATPILSARDAALPRLQEFVSPF